MNAYLKTFENQVYEAEHFLIKDKESVTTESLKRKILGVEEKVYMLVSIFEEHNKKMEALIGDEYAPRTLERYRTSLRHTIEFMKLKYNTICNYKAA